MSDIVIKTTAKVHETSEPDRHKPIIRIDDTNGRTIVSHISNSNELANTIRASIDSGRDNPFRPDGEIYKMTDPIVDFYKFGPTLSRSQTPTYANLNASSSSPPPPSSSSSKKQNRDNKLRWRRKTAAAESAAAATSSNKSDDNFNDSVSGEIVKTGQQRSCWRKWFCCCCCCCCRKFCGNKESGDTQQQAPLNGTTTGLNGSQISSNIDYYNSNQAPKDLTEQQQQRRQQQQQQMKTKRPTKTTTAGSQTIIIDSIDSKSQPQAHPIVANDPVFKQTRVVLLSDKDRHHHDHHHHHHHDHQLKNGSDDNDDNNNNDNDNDNNSNNNSGTLASGTTSKIGNLSSNCNIDHNGDNVAARQVNSEATTTRATTSKCSVS